MNFNIAKKGKNVGCKLNEFKVESGGEVFQKPYTVAERERWGYGGVIREWTARTSRDFL